MAIGIVSKGGVRELCNEVDDIAVEIRLKVQAEIDRTTDKIDAELNSCGRELNTSSKILLQIPQLMQRLAQQIGPDAPIHIKNSLASITDEVVAKVQTIAENITEVQKNIKDVDKYTDQIDDITDVVAGYCKKLDEITDRYQK